MKKILRLSALISLFAVASAGHAFIVKQIDVEGLQRISKGTVYSYLPIKIGADVTPTNSNEIIEALYDTGFFSDVTLYQKGSTLVIKVKERSVIGDIVIHGNSQIKSEDLQKGLSQLGVDEGLTYNQSLINKIKVGLEEQYYQMGFYGAVVDIDVKKDAHNRAILTINIQEGALAIVRNINFIGNTVYSDKELISQMPLSTPSWITWLTETDRYSREKFQASLQKVVAYYMDNGYLKVKVDSATVQVTPNKANVYMTVKLTEGEKYTVKGFKITGKTAIPVEQLNEAVAFEDGQTFSLQKVIDTENKIKDMLGAKGYAYANVTFTPKIDEKNHTVFINLAVDQGDLVYVRQINFLGNYKTNESVLRNNMAQVEGSLYNSDSLKQSKRQLNQLQYLKGIDIKTEQVPDKKDQVDLNVNMEEVSSAQISAGIGYSEMDGVILNASLVQKNVFGTGKSLRLQVVHSSYQETYGFDWFNPYYTDYGISRGFAMNYTHYDPSAANISSDYSYDQYGGRIYYNIPMSASVGANNKLALGYGIQGTDLEIHEDEASTQVIDFVDDYGDNFLELMLTGGWTHNGFNRAVFPTQGFYQTWGNNIYLPATSDSLGYFTTKYQAKFYAPISKNFIFYTRGEAGYGGGFIKTNQLPFYSNFYAGGMQSVRGYEGNSLGPRDSNGDPYGGNIIIDGSVSLIFPNFISPDNLRTSIFVDGGQVYEDEGVTNDTGVALENLRYSVGLDVQWLSPIGMLEFSLAKALNPSSDDTTQFFDFYIGAYF